MKAYIAMSGGVDSSVAALLMKQAGHDITGVTLRLHDKQGCGSADDAQQAAAVCAQLGASHQIWDASPRFRASVMDHFAHSYLQGRTPNPCINCNRYLKLGTLLDRALAEGADLVVTGHYARITFENGRWQLRKAADEGKDQTYFLYTLTQHQLAHTLFPLGDLTKAQARKIAEEQGFINAKKHDSQDICFVPDGDYLAFMQRHTGKEYATGDFLDISGKAVGQHKGAVGYTLGQRKGLGLAMGAPVYVCSKDMAANTVTVGPNEALFHNCLRAADWNWIAMDALTQPMRVLAKARSRQTEQPAWVYPEENGFVRVEFDEPQRAITPGQAVVLYDGDTVVGGGTITEAFSG